MNIEFIFNRPVALEESLTCEFKEVPAQPIQVIGKAVDRQVVGFLNASGGSIYWGIRDRDRAVMGFDAPYKLQDELRQVIGQKVSTIAPSLPPQAVETLFHPVVRRDGSRLDDIRVLEVRTRRPTGAKLYLTGNGEAYRRFIAGVRKLSGAELLLALMEAVKDKVEPPHEDSYLANIPSVYRRYETLAPLIQGRRVLWVDDDPASTLYERLSLAEMGLHVDVAISTREGLLVADSRKPAVILSDMRRENTSNEGIHFLRQLRKNRITVPVVFYVGDLQQDRGVPGGAFGITSRPDEVLHLVLDALSRSLG